MGCTRTNQPQSHGALPNKPKSQPLLLGTSSQLITQEHDSTDISPGQQLRILKEIAFAKTVHPLHTKKANSNGEI